MRTLDEIFNANGTDKGSQFGCPGYAPHNLGPVYEEAFAPLRLEPIKLLEIGVQGGASIKSWLEYFPSAQIYGIDLREWTHPDPRMESLHHQVSAAVARAADEREDAAVTFQRVRELADRAAGVAPRAHAAPARNRKRPPRLTEPWFC